MDEKIESKFIPVEEINTIGKKFVHHFLTKDKEIKEIETTEEDYSQLESKNPKNPIMDGAEWLGSAVRDKYSTISGDMIDGQCVSYQDKYLLRIMGRDILLDKKDIINNQVSEELIKGKFLWQ